MWSSDRYLERFRGTRKHTPSTKIVVEPESPKGTPSDGIVPKHNHLMDRLAEAHYSQLVGISRLYDEMRCPLTPRYITHTLTNDLRRDSFFIKPKLFTSVQLTDHNVDSSHVVIVVYDDDDNPNDVLICDDKIRDDMKKTLDSSSQKWEWVRINKNLNNIEVPWDASMGTKTLDMNDTNGNVEDYCVDIVMKRFDNNPIIGKMNHFYYKHVHAVSNITKGKIMMDVCKSFAYACGCSCLKLQDASYNAVKNENRKTTYSHDQITKTMETLLRKGSTVYTMYGFLPDNAAASLDIPNTPRYVEVDVHWDQEDVCHLYIQVDEEPVVSGAFRSVYDSMIQPILEGIANTPVIWYGEASSATVREVLETGYRDFVNILKPTQSSSPFLSPGDEEFVDFYTDSPFVDIENFDEIMRELDFEEPMRT